MSPFATTKDVYNILKTIEDINFSYQQTDDCKEGSLLKYPNEFCTIIKISKYDKKFSVGELSIWSSKNKISIYFSYKKIETKIEMSCQTFVNSLKSFKDNPKDLIEYIFRQIYLENDIEDNVIKLLWIKFDTRNKLKSK